MTPPKFAVRDLVQAVSRLTGSVVIGRATITDRRWCEDKFAACSVTGVRRPVPPSWTYLLNRLPPCGTGGAWCECSLRPIPPSAAESNWTDLRESLGKGERVGEGEAA